MKAVIDVGRNVFAGAEDLPASLCLDASVRSEEHFTTPDKAKLKRSVNGKSWSRFGIVALQVLSRTAYPALRGPPAEMKIGVFFIASRLI